MLSLDFSSVQPIFMGGKVELYYERRSKQYELNDRIDKTRVISLAVQTASYIAMFLNEPHSTHRYYGELLRSYSNRIYLERDAYDPYYIAAYYNFFVESCIKNSIIKKEYKKYKYHLICAIKALAVGGKVVFGNKRMQEKMCKELFSLIEQREELKRLLECSITCLEEVLKEVKDIPTDNLYRNKKVTALLLDKVLLHMYMLN